MARKWSVAFRRQSGAALRASAPCLPCLRVATVSRRSDQLSRDIRLEGEGVDSDWLTVRRHTWPGSWPPRVGQVLRLHPPRVELVGES